MSIATQITALQIDKENIANAIVSKGGTVNDGDGFDDFATDIGTIPEGGASGDTSTWTRPAHRLPKPTINNNEVLWLYGVKDTRYNWFSFSASTDGTQYKVDWGDGTVEILDNNAIAFHSYPYNALTDIEPDPDGYKELWVKLTPVNTGENLKTLSLSAKPEWLNGSNNSSYIKTVLELYIRASELNTILWDRAGNATSQVPYADYDFCDIFGLYENSLTLCNGMCIGFTSLKQIDSLDINNIPELNCFLQGCEQYNKPFPENITFDNVVNNFMYGCASYNQPFSEGVTLRKVGSYFMYQCSSYNQEFPSTVVFEKMLTHFMRGAINFDKTVRVEMPSDYRSTVSTTGILGQTSCTGIYLKNYSQFILNFNTFPKLDREIALQVFNGLRYISDSASSTVDITGTYAATQLTDEDKLIATNKNWTLVGV